MALEQGRYFTLAVMALGLAMAAVAGIAARRQVYDWAEEESTSWKYGDQPVVEF